MEETIKFVEDEEAVKKRDELLAAGYQWQCLGCRLISKEKRRERYENGHGSRMLDMCACGSDLFRGLAEIPCKDVVVSSVDGTLVFKEHHAKYCKCELGELWTGDSSTECQAGWESMGKKEGNKIYCCSKSGLKIIILPSTMKELTSPDEMGSSYQRAI